MLKISIETGYINKSSGTDTYGTRFFMQQYFQKYNIELVRVSLNKFINKKQYFTEYNIFDIHGKNELIKKKYIPNIIWSRHLSGIYHKYNTFKHIPTIPSQKITIISNDKFENYQFVGKYQPFTTLLSSFFTNTSIQKSFTNKIVIKPIRAHSGKGIILSTIPELLKKKKKYNGLEELYIVQQFKDFGKGYPGICAGNHDVRFMFAGKNIIESTLRIPKKSDFRSNIGLGGSQYLLEKKYIPKDLLSLTKKIYKKLDINDDNIFSMDFAYCKKDKQRYLLEINASPGTWYYQTDKKKLATICRGLVNFFKKYKTNTSFI